ncbi:MAG: hypothetical protein H0T87_10070 [Gammaproteobacteria bacterium]|nr:hypothetical protein [Gammaproteobacteria bacterium]
MKKGRNRISGFAYTCRARPFAWTPWFDLAVKTGEMLGASAYVIGHRADRLARAGTKPSVRDRREFTRMVEEKFEAAAESAAAMAPALWSLQARGAEIAARQTLAGLQAMIAVGRRGMVPRSSAAVSRAAAGSRKLGSSLVQCARKGLKPVHARAVANRKRLSKRKRV